MFISQSGTPYYLLAVCQAIIKRIHVYDIFYELGEISTKKPKLFFKAYIL